MTPELQSISRRVETIVKSELGWSDPIPKGILADKLDSMQLLSLSVAIEDHYEICFEPEEEEKALTFDDLIALIAVKIGVVGDHHDHR